MSKDKQLEWTGERLTTIRTNEIMIHHLHRYALALEIAKDKVVLDIASGEGYGSNLLASMAAKVIGVDISEQAILFAQEKYSKSNLSFTVGSADKIPLGDNEIDVVVSFETIEHHDKHEEMLEEFKRVLKPNGVLIISSPDKLYYSDIPKFSNPFHVKELYQKEFKALMSKHFQYIKMFNQNILYGSLMVSEEGTGSGFLEFKGSFNQVEKFDTLSVPMYNLCIASNVPLAQELIKENSFFNAPNLLEEYLNKQEEIYRSKTYRAGMLVTFPFRILRRIFKRSNQ